MSKPKRIPKVEVVEEGEIDLPFDFDEEDVEEPTQVIQELSKDIDQPKEEIEGLTQDFNWVKQEQYKLEDIPNDAEAFQQELEKEKQLQSLVKKEVKNYEYEHVDEEHKEPEKPKDNSRNIANIGNQYGVSGHLGNIANLLSQDIDTQSMSSIALTIKKAEKQ
mmetsp:Transcript_12807/g.11350  ORF Transcript_12807/g.11350 Transcript_12807/m.11350 type:complete len:163 (+) Transcript_12807:391-879(+)